MKRSALLLPLLAVAGCSSDPTRLWLALNGSELQVRLVPVEPDPF
jgi:hypothetical protein